jgi:hypothetical protein
MSRGTANITTKLAKSIEDGDHYEALQMYKTLYFRNMGFKKYDTVLELMLSGTNAMLKNSHINAAIELSSLWFEALTTSGKPISKDILENIKQIYTLLAPQNEGNTKQIFIKNSFKWIASKKDKEAERELHGFFGVMFFQEQDFASSSKHFTKSSAPKEFANMLAEWSNHGLPSEKDLFLFRAILQTLTQNNVITARETLSFFLSDHQLNTPLINFARFLVMIIDNKETYKFFDMLKKNYEPFLKRDPQLLVLLDQISQQYYNVGGSTNNSGMGGLFQGLLRGLMTDAPPS